MRKKILIALGVIVVVLAGLAGVVAMQPADFRIVRSATIPAPPAEVFAQVNDFHNWEAWSPWKKLDPAATKSFEGSASGKDAIFKWSGNSEIGVGSMTITESRPNDLIRIRLDFVKPFEDTSTAEFTFKPEGEQTLVTWSMYGRKNFIGKAICMFMNMDKMVGGSFEEGLANIKAVVEPKRQKKEGT
jgi:uncharacterized protein YndB with AHSA1/START domain